MDGITIYFTIVGGFASIQLSSKVPENITIKQLYKLISEQTKRKVAKIFHIGKHLKKQSIPLLDSLNPIAELDKPISEIGVDVELEPFNETVLNDPLLETTETYMSHFVPPEIKIQLSSVKRCSDLKTEVSIEIGKKQNAFKLMNSTGMECSNDDFAINFFPAGIDGVREFEIQELEEVKVPPKENPLLLPVYSGPVCSTCLIPIKHSDIPTDFSSETDNLVCSEQCKDKFIRSGTIPR